MAKQSARKIYIPKLTEMLPRQIETLKWIAGNHQKIITLKNGLIVHPNGKLAVDREKTMFYDAVIDAEGLIERVKAIR